MNEEKSFGAAINSQRKPSPYVVLGIKFVLNFIAFSEVKIKMYRKVIQATIDLSAAI
jgi:hypothetical protein